MVRLLESSRTWGHFYRVLRSLQLRFALVVILWVWIHVFRRALHVFRCSIIIKYVVARVTGVDLKLSGHLTARPPQVSHFA